MNEIVLFPGGFLKKVEKKREEMRKEEKIQIKSQIQTQLSKIPAETMRKVAYLVTAHRECLVPLAVYSAWIESGRSPAVIDAYLRTQGFWQGKLPEPEFTTYRYEEEDEEA
jgi:hypothetical protein